SPLSPAPSPAALPSDGTGSGTHGGTIGTFEGDPKLDCDVPILLLPSNSRFHRPADIHLAPGTKDIGRPWLVADLGHDAGLDLHGRPLPQKGRQPRALDRIG